MALIVRIDVDRPYGKHPLRRHLWSRLGSDLYFPHVEVLGYLDELKRMLGILNNAKARSYVFFRKCTLPSIAVMSMMTEGGHEVGLHLENSRTQTTFIEEKQTLESHVKKPIRAVSKHGSGGTKYGYHHYAPYEPERYLEWAKQAGMNVFLGNLEDPTLMPNSDNGLVSFPSAFWLEPSWRDTSRFTEEWLLTNASQRDIVMLVHPENVFESPELTTSFTHLVTALETKIF
jgi:hypothetical protein